MCIAHTCGLVTAPTKLPQGNVFTPVCHSGSQSRRGVSVRKTPMDRDPPPRLVTSRRYASYWNAFFVWESIYLDLDCCNPCVKYKTRMHSSRMHSARLLPVSPSMHCSRVGVPAQEVYLPGGEGCTCPGTPPLWTEWQTGAKILPFPKLHLRAVITSS